MHLLLLDGYAAPNVKAWFTISLLGWNGKAVPGCTHASTSLHKFTPLVAKGFPKFIKWKALEQSAFLRGDCFRVCCSITLLVETSKEDIAILKGTNKKEDIKVLKETKKEEEEDAPATFVAVPPPDMHRHFEHLLLSGEGADVTLEVDGGTFRAHRSILAARSPVFKAELFSPMEERTASTCVRIKDIEPRVFTVLLYFIYTDSLPDIAEGETMAVAQHLLVAADRYSLERLKLMCEDKLCNYIGTSSVGTYWHWPSSMVVKGLKRHASNFSCPGPTSKRP